MNVAEPHAGRHLDISIRVGADEAGKRFAFVLDIQGLPDGASATRLALWFRDCIKEHDDEIAEMVFGAGAIGHDQVQ